MSARRFEARSGQTGKTGSYTRVSTIARGGMGYVDLAYKQEGRFLRWYAMKRLHPQHLEDAAFRAMFMDEARLAGLVHHPNVIGAIDMGEDDDGPFLIMDFVQGVPASKLVAQAVEHDRLLPIQVAVRICLEAARGLHAAHQLRGSDGTPLNLVHRDVSTQNILIGFDGAVRVTDFGIAKAAGNVTRTSAGVLKGNMGYMSPEQLEFQALDLRSDLFSLGVTLYELLSARRLYPNVDGFDGTRRILAEPPPDISDVRKDVAPDLVELLFELLAKDRNDRPASADEVAGRLEGVLSPLVAEEGALTVGEFMRQHFVDIQQSQVAMLADAAQKIARGFTARASVNLLREHRWPFAVAAVLLPVVVVAAVQLSISRPVPPAPAPASKAASPGEAEGSAAAAKDGQLVPQPLKERPAAPAAAPALGTKEGLVRPASPRLAAVPRRRARVQERDRDRDRRAVQPEREDLAPAEPRARKRIAVPLYTTWQ